MACLGVRCRSPASDEDSLDQDDGGRDGENWTSVRWDLWTESPGLGKDGYWG